MFWISHSCILILYCAWIFNVSSFFYCIWSTVTHSMYMYYVCSQRWFLDPRFGQMTHRFTCVSSYGTPGYQTMSVVPSRRIQKPLLSQNTGLAFQKTSKLSCALEGCTQTAWNSLTWAQSNWEKRVWLELKPELCLTWAQTRTGSDVGSCNCFGSTQCLETVCYCSVAGCCIN